MYLLTYLLLNKAHDKGINHFHVMGDSNLVIKWANKNHNMNNLELIHFMNQIVEVKYHFHAIYFTHVCREFNLSKDYLLLQEGTFIEKVSREGTILLAS